MKRILTVMLFLAVSVPNFGFAAGLSTKGDVTFHVSGAQEYMWGYMNVRYNADIAGKPYVYAHGYIGSKVYFGGRDSNGEYFVCTVSPDSTMYDDAVDIKNNLKNGGRLIVWKAIEGTECTQVAYANYSQQLD